jgi:hypothetical protein
MLTITHAKIGLLDHIESDGRSMTVVAIITIDDAGADGQAVGQMKKMIVVATTLMT